jgi:hypothetical protein
MATIAFQYNARNSVMKHVFDACLAAGAKIIPQSKTDTNYPYNKK